MTKNSDLRQRQALLLLEQLLSEPVHDSPTADDLIQAMQNGDGILATQLFNKTNVGLIVNLPAADGERLMGHLNRIGDATEIHIAQYHQGKATKRAEQMRRDAEILYEKLQESQRELAAAQHAPAIDAPAAPTPSPAIALEPEPQPGTIASKKGRKSPRFSALEPGYLAERSRVGGYSQQTLSQVRATFRLWVELVGDKPVADYTGKDAGAFREMALRLPASHGKGGRVHAVEAIKEADRRELETGHVVPRLSMKTTKRHFSALSQMWTWMLPRDEVERNIFRGFTFPGTKSTRAQRDAWSDEDIIKLFRSDWLGPDVDADAAQRWLPIVALLAGLRLEEICRLRPAKDVVQVDGVWCFKIWDHPEEDWSPKSEAGERLVPVHPVLIELGFVEMVLRRRADGSRRVFRELRATGPDSKFGTEFSRKFGKMKTSLGIGSKTVFHSFRHSYRTVLGNTDLKDSWIDAVLGHESGGSVGIKVYLKEIGIVNLQRVVDAVVYPDAVLQAVRSAAYPNGGGPIFPANRSRRRPTSSPLMLDAAYLRSIGTIRVPGGLWRAFRRFSSWIEPSLTFEWIRLMKAYAARSGRAFDEGAAAVAMIWSDPDRNVSPARRLALAMVNANPPLRCVWTGKRLDAATLDMDHCLPWSAWPCGDLWNLMPAHCEVNRHLKRGKLPSAPTLRNAGPAIRNWWLSAYVETGEVMRLRFLEEAAASLPTLGSGLATATSDQVFVALELQRLRLRQDQRVPEWHRTNTATIRA